MAYKKLSPNFVSKFIILTFIFKLFLFCILWYTTNYFSLVLVVSVVKIFGLNLDLSPNYLCLQILFIDLGSISFCYLTFLYYFIHNILLVIHYLASPTSRLLVHLEGPQRPDYRLKIMLCYQPQISISICSHLWHALRHVI